MIGAGGGPTPPLPYTPVEYIETDGVAYIDTGITGVPSKSAEIKVLPVAGSSQTFLGSRGSSTDGEAKKFIPFRMLKYASDDSYRIGFGYYYNANGTSYPSVTNSVANGTPFVGRGSYKSGEQIVSVKEQGESEFTSMSKSYTKSISSSLKLFLLALNDNGTVAEIAVSGTRLYYCKIWSDATYSTLVFNGEPCYYEGEYGIWDKVSNSFKGNANSTGAFTGPSIL